MLPVQQAKPEASQKPRQRKRDEAIGGVHAAVEAAKLAAKQAMQAAGMGMNAIHAQQAGKERPVLGEMRRALPPQEQQPQPLAPQPKQPAEKKLLHAKDPDDSPARPHRPPAPQLPAEGALMEGDIEQYESVLQRHRREQEGARRVGQGGRDLSASGYPLVLKNGLEIFVSDEDLRHGAVHERRRCLGRGCGEGGTTQ